MKTFADLYNIIRKFLPTSNLEWNFEEVQPGAKTKTLVIKIHVNKDDIPWN